jgi:hypothetical protein
MGGDRRRRMGWRRGAGRRILRRYERRGKIMINKRGLVFGALLVLASGHAFAAELDRRLDGAWATSPADCKKLFVRGGGGVVFRQPVDQFAQAAIITPGSVVMPNQTCQVTDVAHKNGLTTLEMNCRDEISYTTQSVEIEVRSSSSVVFRPNGDKTLDTSLMKCGT